MKRMQKIVTNKMVDGFLSVRGNHHEFYRQSEVYMKVINELLTTFEHQAK